MLEFRDVPDTNLVEFAIDGNVSRAEFDDVIKLINAKIEQYGSVGLLEEIRSIGLTDPATMMEDIKWMFSHFKDIERCAVVGDHAWLQGMITMMSPLFSMDIRYFDQASIDEARTWLQDAAKKAD